MPGPPHPILWAMSRFFPPVDSSDSDVVRDFDHLDLRVLRLERISDCVDEYGKKSLSARCRQLRVRAQVARLAQERDEKGQGIRLSRQIARRVW